jgi:hypothetical protein
MIRRSIGPDAEAVSRYIHDAFYSREARARNHPARVELVRLTNRQYVNTVADLIRHFAGDEDGTTAEGGLRGTYYSSRNFNRKNQERVDRQVNFDFGTNGPDGAPASTNGFSIQWRGSIIADETGDYDFVLKTPNGARLRVNDEEETLIDASVASGELHEHKATIRLIGGRTYPFQLDYFKFKEKTALVSLLWKPPHGVQEPIPARNLSTARAKPTFVLTTPFPPDDSSVGYERGVAVSKAWDEATTQAAIEVANHVINRLDRLSRSRPDDTNRTTKVASFCEEFVATAFRRPLTPEQKRIFVSAPFKSARKLDDAVKRVVLLTLKSPRFLYLGLHGGKPDAFEVASRLSFGLWDSLPDQALSGLAAEDKLRTREQVSQEARRMLSNPRARAKMQAFLHHWLQVNQVDDLSKDAKLYPGFTPEIIADLRTSLNLFLDDVIWSGSSDYRQLLLADYLFLNDRLAGFYGGTSRSRDGR